MEQTSKREIAQAWHSRYLQAGRREKGQLVDELVALTGYHRTYAQTLLRQGPASSGTRARRTGRPLSYGARVVAALEVAAEATGWICGKRLVAALPEVVPALVAEGAVVLDAAEQAALLTMSAATIDRKLAAVRAQHKPRGLPTTKPGSLLKAQVPVRTYTPWDEQRPGFAEIDLVAHCGPSGVGDFLYTLDVVDVATGWTECAALANKGQVAVVAALQQLRARLPFPLLGLDSDNGSEFLNAHLIRYCQQEHLTFTRCRAYHKNDQAHVEQKNYAVVRQLIGYDRYASEAARAQLESLYALVRLWINGVLPVMKLVSKERVGARLRKTYDTPTTPYHRARAAGVLTLEGQARFAAQRAAAAAGPLALRRRIHAELERLWALASVSVPSASRVLN